MNLNNLDTEQSNPDSLHIDEMSTIDILTTINNEDQKVADYSTLVDHSFRLG